MGWNRDYRTPDLTRSAPIFWTKVFSRADAKWLPVNLAQENANKRGVFGPFSILNHPQCTRVENRMIYVISFEEDGYAGDVAPCYAEEYGAKVTAERQGREGMGGSTISRPFRSVGAFVSLCHRVALTRGCIEPRRPGRRRTTNQSAGREEARNYGRLQELSIVRLERHLRRDEVVHPAPCRAWETSAASPCTRVRTCWRSEQPRTGYDRDARSVKGAGQWGG